MKATQIKFMEERMIILQDKQRQMQKLIGALVTRIDNITSPLRASSELPTHLRLPLDLLRTTEAWMETQTIADMTSKGRSNTSSNLNTLVRMGYVDKKKSLRIPGRPGSISSLFKARPEGNNNG